MMSASLTSAPRGVDPLVSVIVNCYNGERYLREAIESVFAQTYPNWELILWDNASVDATASIARAAAAQDCRLRYFRADANTSLGIARNQAIRNARGTYIAFLDCDDRWLPEKLKVQVELLERRRELDFLYGNFYFTRPGSERLHRGLKRRQPEGRIFGSLLRYFAINLQTVILRRSALQQLSEWFDDRLSLAEDYDLFLRFLHGREAAYIHAPLVVYRMHAEMSSIRHAQKYPDELVYCVDKLRRMFPGLAQDFPAEMDYLEGKIAFWRARAAIAAGHRSAGRSLLRPHRGKSLVFFLLHCATFLPSGLWLKLQELRLFLR